MEAAAPSFSRVPAYAGSYAAGSLLTVEHLSVADVAEILATTARLEEMMELPGIGRSTAGAILAISRGERHPILDGNVKRVLARVFGIAGDPSSNAVLAALWQRSDACTPSNDVADYTQAIMDLGATVCTRTPACTVCPMATGCVATPWPSSEFPATERNAGKFEEFTFCVLR